MSEASLLRQADDKTHLHTHIRTHSIRIHILLLTNLSHLSFRREPQLFQQAPSLSPQRLYHPQHTPGRQSVILAVPSKGKPFSLHLPFLPVKSPPFIFFIFSVLSQSLSPQRRFRSSSSISDFPFSFPILFTKTLHHSITLSQLSPMGRGGYN